MNTININAPIAPNNVIKKNSSDKQNIDLQKNFLILLIAQIQNQDPTDPIKNTELTSHLAQMNTANGVERLNIAVKKISHEIIKNENIQLSSLIGHRVITPSNEIIHTKDIPTKFGLELMSHATVTNIKILDQNNQVLYQNTIKDKEPGIYTFLWNGKDLNNNVLNTGKYKISVTAKNNDTPVATTSLSESVVHSIITSSEEPIIDLGPAGYTTLLNIREILKEKSK